jgi:mRNA-degrading endonuclease RelE of RelBE toxin-antitoxin system
MYKVLYEHNVKKDLRSLPKKLIKQVLDKIESILASNPLAGGRLEYRGKKLYKYRVRDYRVIYTINTEKNTIIIYRIRHRKEVSQNLDVIK